MSQTRPARSRPRRRTIVLVGLVALVVAFGAYLYASSVVYDAISLTAADCGGRWQTNTPAAFTSPDLDTTPYLMPRLRGGAVREPRPRDRDQRLVRARGDPRARTRRRPGPRPRFVQARRQDPAGGRHAPSGGDRGAPGRPAQPRRLDRRERPVRGRDTRVSRRPRRLGLAGQRSRLRTRPGRAVRAVAGRGDRAHRDRRGAPRRRPSGPTAATATWIWRSRPS